MLLKAEAT